MHSKSALIVHVFVILITLQAYLSVHPETRNSNHFQGGVASLPLTISMVLLSSSWSNNRSGSS
jgi:hypothetical protein